MKKLYLILSVSVILLSQSFDSKAQVNLPYTLQFTANNPAQWADGIAEDGDGGTADINGLELQMYTAGTDHTSLFSFGGNKQSTIEWYDNTYYFSSSASYTGITSGPSVDATNQGVPAMVIKSADNSINFSLKSIQLYDWGYTQIIIIETYDNGTKIGTVEFTPNPSYLPSTVSQSDLLTPSVFNNIDEIRFFPKSGQTYDVFNLSFNNISLAASTGTLPVTFSSIQAIEQNNTINVQWKVSNETGIQKYQVERSSDGKNFNSLYFENAKSNSGAGVIYNWTDENPLPENNFYRIQSIDKSGKKEYSSVAKVNLGTPKPSVAIYPNPASEGIIHVQLNHIQQGSYYLKLINSQGKVLIQKTLTLPEGNTNETLNFRQFPKGIYLLQIKNPDNTIIKRTVVH
jgi:hypothetical protein